jgi:putative membrane protein
MKHAAIIGAVALALSAAPAFAQSGQSGTQPRPNATKAQKHSSGKSATVKGASKQEFIRDAAQDDMAEVQLGQLAQQKGHSEAVKQLGQKLVTDHSNNQEQLKDLAKSANVTWPASVNAKQKQLKQKLQGLNGEAFDRAYANAMVKDHKKAIAEFQTAANQSSDADVRAFAQKTLPVLQQHLQLAQDAQQKVVGTSGRKKNK